MPMFGAGFGQRLAAFANNAGSILQDVDDPNGRSAERLDMQRAQDAQENEFRRQQALAQQQQWAAEQARYNRPQLFNSGDGQITAVDPNTQQVTQLQAPRPAAPHQTPLAENLALLRQLNPGMTDAQAAAIVQRGISGYQYDPAYIQQHQADQLNLAQTRAGLALRNKQAPTYSNLHPRTPAGGMPASSSPSAAISTADLLAALRGGH